VEPIIDFGVLYVLVVDPPLLKGGTTGWPGRRGSLSSCPPRPRVQTACPRGSLLGFWHCISGQRLVPIFGRHPSRCFPVAEVQKAARPLAASDRTRHFQARPVTKADLPPKPAIAAMIPFRAQPLGTQDRAAERPVTRRDPHTCASDDSLARDR